MENISIEGEKENQKEKPQKPFQMFFLLLWMKTDRQD